VNVRIVKAQKINRQKYEAGDIAVFDDRTALWLIEQRIAESIDAVEIPTAPRAMSQPRATTSRPQFAPRWSCCGPRKK